MSFQRSIIYIDHEGGWGGSSRSLYYLLANLDRERYMPHVLLGREGPAADRLVNMDISFEIVNGLPSLTARSARNMKNWIAATPKFLKIYRIAQYLVQCHGNLLHFNYDGLIPLAFVISRIGDRRPKILHVRVMNPVNRVTKVYAQLAAQLFDHIIFISENELMQFVQCGFDVSRTSHSILANPVDAALFSIPRSKLASPDPFRISFFGSLDNYRAADRLVEVARILKRRRRNVVFDIYGRNPPYKKFFLFDRKANVTLRSQMLAAGVDDVMIVRGHTSAPEQEMATSHLIIRPSRGNDPWGRDVIESMCVGCPILATGSYEGYIKHGETGVLLDPWSPAAAADWIERLIENPDLLERFGRAARMRAKMLFDPSIYAQKIEAIYDCLLNRSTFDICSYS